MSKQSPFAAKATVRAKPEFEDCRALAERHGIPLAEVYACIARVAKDARP